LKPSLLVKATTIKVLIAGGLTAIRQGMSMSFSAEADYEVVGDASSCQQTLEMVKQLSPHLLIIDLDLPEVDGIEVAEIVRSISPRTVVILVSMQDDLLTCLQAKHSGAAALLPKSMPIANMLSAIREITAGTRRVYSLSHLPKPPFEPKLGRTFSKDHIVMSLKYHKR
jgi:DNA-binding NarL/FixJ family response regulator